MRFNIQQTLPCRRFGAAAFALAAALAAGPASAQAPAAVRADTSHLTVTTSISGGGAAPGQRLTLQFDVAPKRGMHVYAPGKHDYQVVSISFDQQPWLKVMPTRYPPSEVLDFKELNEKVEVYSKPFRLDQEVSVLATPEARTRLAGQSTVTISGTFDYQACDDVVCYNPKKVPFSFTLKLDPPAGKPSGGV